MPFIHVTGLSVCGTGYNETVHFLLAPSTVLKFDGQPVEQIHVQGIFTLYTQIFRCLDQTGSEKSLPHPIDLYP